MCMYLEIISICPTTNWDEFYKLDRFFRKFLIHDTIPRNTNGYDIPCTMVLEEAFEVSSKRRGEIIRATYPNKS